MMDVSTAIASRMSCRAFLNKAVADETVMDLLNLARRAASGGNLQPWRVYILTPSARERLIQAVREKLPETPMGEEAEYSVYPPKLSEPYRSRRYKVGEDLYATIGIARDNKPGRMRQFARNYQFFDAPVALLFTMDRQMQEGQWADLGMFMQNIMLLARERGLHTCAQEAWAVWHKTIRTLFDIPQNEMVFCGMAIGYMDESAPINSLSTERAPIEEFATVLA